MTLPENVLYRIARGDAKGRMFGTPRNPRPPTLEEFNPRFMDVPAGDLEHIIIARRHGTNDEQARQIAALSNEAIIEFRLQDPISGIWHDGLLLTGGHHRTAEVILRVDDGRMDPKTLVRILIHD